MTDRSALRPRVVIAHRYFTPDTPPYATILQRIAIALTEAGFEVSVLTCQPSYRGRSNVRAAPRERIGAHLTVRRWGVLPDRFSTGAKIINLLVFSLRLAVELCRIAKPDVVMAASTPPVVVALVVSVVARMRGAAFVYHKQDIYPEILARHKSWLLRWALIGLRRVDARTDRRASVVVVASRDMAETVQARGGEECTVAVINNFDPWQLEPVRLSEREPGEPVQIFYAGNIGGFQDIAGLVGLMEQFGEDPRVFFTVIGDGSQRTWLERQIESRGLRNVSLEPYQAPERLARRLQRDCDLGVVSLRAGVIRDAYPSKTMSYLRHGVPVLALMETDSELCECLERYSAGWSADPRSPNAASAVLRRLLEEPALTAAARAGARRMYEVEFSEQQMVPRWTNMFHKLTRHDCPAIHP